MKRIAILLTVLLVAVLPALTGACASAEAADFTPFDYHTMYTANGKYVVYEFPDITLLLPIEWKDAITVEQRDDCAAFYQTASHEKYQAEGSAGGGLLFELRASEDERFRELPAFTYLGCSENAGLHFYLALPTDYPAYPEDEIRAEYDAMAAQIDIIPEKARIGASMHYYTEGIEHTDAGRS